MRMTATIDSTGAVELDTAGQITRENHSTVGDARRAVMATAKSLAEQTSQDMQLHIEDPSGSRTFLVGADGTSRQESVAPAGGQVSAGSVATMEPVASAPVESPAPMAAATEEDQAVAPVAATSTAPNPFLGGRPSTARPVAAEPAAAGSRRESLPSFVAVDPAGTCPPAGATLSCREVPSAPTRKVRDPAGSSMCSCMS